MMLDLRERSRWLLLSGLSLGLGCDPAIVDNGGEGDETRETHSTGDYGDTESSTGWGTSVTIGPDGTSTGGVGVTSNATYSTGVYTTYGSDSASDTWGTSYGTTWDDTAGSSTGWPVLDPEDCDYLAPDQCEGQGGIDFACVLRTGYLLESAASCSFDEYTELCVALALPQSPTCDELPSCPNQGAATVWAGHSLGEPVVLVQQGCEAYPSLDYCIADSPDPSCACACAADVAGGG